MNKKVQPKSSGGPVSRFIQHHFRHFNAATLVDAARAYRAHLDKGGRMMICLAGAMSTAELGPVPRGNDSPRQGASDHLHRGEPGGGRVQSRRTRLLRACAALPASDAAGGRGIAQPPSEPCDRHLHSRRRSHASHGESHARSLDGGGEGRQTMFPSRIFLSGFAQRQIREILSDRPEGFVDAGRRREKICPSSCLVGRTRPSATCTPPRSFAAT